MILFLSAFRSRTGLKLIVAATVILSFSSRSLSQSDAAQPLRSYFIDCSAAATGNGSIEHPWNTLAAAEAQPFQPGDRIALARGSVCRGSFAPQGSGTEERPIRLTANGKGPRPRIVASAKDRQSLLLFNQQHWQIDSLDISGGNTYGVFVSGDKGPLRGIYLKNLYIHDVFGGALKNKDNGLLVVGPSALPAVFSNVLVDGVDVAHTNQWSGILLGGGNFAFPENAPLNSHITVRNSTAHDVFGDGIILFRDTESLIQSSSAWLTGMQPTQDIGTPNAIWTWTCSGCTVEDNEAFLTDSPGVDGGAYDIDWDNTRNIVQRNYAHDTQGYCIAVFAAGYVTSESVVQDNLCINNGLSPRLASLQGAIYLHTWDGGVIRGLKIEQNTVQWNPPFPGAAAIVSDAAIEGQPAIFTRNHIVSSSPLIYRTNSQWVSSYNTYSFPGKPLFTIGDRHNISLADLQSSGSEAGSSLSGEPELSSVITSLRIDASLRLSFDRDGLLTPDIRAQLLVLRNLAAEYGPGHLTVTVHLQSGRESDYEANALRDFEALYPGVLRFDHSPVGSVADGVVRLSSHEGHLLQEWRGFQNAATLGLAVRSRLGAPHYEHMQ